ncbi:unnamed protein product [Kuraishia capsulata CBS 1993]|uniref:J domain-containing protein n=1 Tax=Kuraishia capsulata CBS 1993 TaxID=1382522 RepID=W6MJ42_9ASCO|nr:uncharacterized protein KUCA_T00001949001 [Kuraishia capsulata CBS 1993]CDK25978.1 unnamed protein product [Kuraishia capsulata CBS 1993]
MVVKKGIVSGKISKKRKIGGRRLKFKRGIQSNQGDDADRKNSADNRTETAEFNGDTEYSESPEVSEPTLRPRTRVKMPSVEYGPEINGYRFVRSVNEEAFEFTTKPHVNNDDDDILHSDSHSHSDSDSVSETSSNSHPASAESEDELSFTHAWSYEDYNRHWESAPSEIAWPVASNHPADLSVESIRSFLDNGRLKKRLKTERVRWHPDKMMVGRSEELKEKVTFTFQCINSIWDECLKSGFH